MAGSDGNIGWGAKLYRCVDGDPGTGAGGTWTEIPGVVEVNPSDPQADETDFTHLQSPGKRKENKPGMSDSGEVSAKCNRIDSSVDPASCAIQEALFGLRNAGTVEPWKIEWYTNDPDAPVLLKTEQFDAWCKSCRIDPITPTGAVTQSFTLRVTSLPVRT